MAKGSLKDFLTRFVTRGGNVEKLAYLNPEGIYREILTFGNGDLVVRGPGVPRLSVNPGFIKSIMSITMASTKLGTLKRVTLRTAYAPN